MKKTLRTTSSLLSTGGKSCVLRRAKCLNAAANTMSNILIRMPDDTLAAVRPRRPTTGEEDSKVNTSTLGIDPDDAGDLPDTDDDSLDIISR